MKFKWTNIEIYDFDEIKRIVDGNTLLAYLHFNEEFKIHTDSRSFQLGAAILKKGKPITFYSRKLTDTQKIYAVTEKELLGIIETLK